MAVITTAFVDGADLMARALGLPGYRYAVISHPISSAGDGELAAKAVDTLRQARVLLSPESPDP